MNAASGTGWEGRCCLPLPPPHASPPFCRLLQPSGQAAIGKSHLPPGHVNRGSQARAAVAWDGGGTASLMLSSSTSCPPPALGATHLLTSWSGAESASSPSRSPGSHSRLALSDPGFCGSGGKTNSWCLPVTPPWPLSRHWPREALHPARRQPLHCGLVNPTPGVVRMRKFGVQQVKSPVKYP